MNKKKCLALVLFFLLLVGCAPKKEQAVEELPLTEDKYRTYYQIFPYAFADSNGDGVGDIQGIIEKLDYIRDLNYDGIWLTPVHPSPTYHKYDVADYYGIDPQFGSLEDYDRLVEECHKRGMTVLMDLVVNHSSVDNPWFIACAGAHVCNRTESEYLNYYNFKPIEKESDIEPGWARYGSYNWAYECRFWTGMPDLNLDEVLENPEGPLAKELTEVLRYWLIDRNIDGFRLDAVTYYFTGNIDRNTLFLTWLNDTAKKIKPDCYIVGEASWGNPGENQRYQASGVDSFFAFQHGLNANGNISYAVRLGKAAYLYLIDEENAQYVEGGIPANFIANHDTGRAYGIAMESAQKDNLKTMLGLLAMTQGAGFTYYGDELGLALLPSGGGNSYKDEDKRQPMPWEDSYRCKPVKGSVQAEDGEKYPLGTVEAQLADENSLPNYVKRANAIRRAYPAIARHQAKQEYISYDRTLCAVSKGEGEGKLFIVWNADHSKIQELDIQQLGEKLRLSATLSVDVNAPSTLKGSTLTLPPRGFAILTIEEP